MMGMTLLLLSKFEQLLVQKPVCHWTSYYSLLGHTCPTTGKADDTEQNGSS